MPETTALGAAMAAGNAEGVSVWTLAQTEAHSTDSTCDIFEPTISHIGE